MTIVYVRDDEMESAVRRFKRMREKSGTIKELRSREAYKKPSEIKKEKHKLAVKRAMKKWHKENERKKILRERFMRRRRQSAVTATAAVSE